MEANVACRVARLIHQEEVLVAFEIPGSPRGKGRPRFSRESGRAYTPEATANYENLVKVLAGKAMNGKPPCDDALQVVVVCYTPMPKSTAKRILAAFEAREKEWPSPKRPDLDNVVKAITDGMNGVVYRDDAQIASIVASKVLVGPGEHPLVEVTVNVLR